MNTMIHRGGPSRSGSPDGTGKAAVKARLLGSVLALAFVALATVGTSVASAGTANSGQDGCLYGHNYADPSTGYLYAASVAAMPDCVWLRVEIRNNGWWGQPGWFVGWCHGDLHTHNENTSSYLVATSVVIDPAEWSMPCSNHRGAPEPDMWLYRFGKLPFLYR